MRILWSSNIPFAPTGYGMTTASCVHWLRRLGHDVAVLAFWGLKGTKVDWGEVPIYPNNTDDWGVSQAPAYFKDFNADIFLTLVDVWVLGGMPLDIPWVPWLPIDHDPPPKIVTDILQKHPAIIQAITQSRFGVEKLQEIGINAEYIPPAINCNLFQPNQMWRDEARDKYNWTKKFVVGCVATNHNERKNWTASFKAFAEFEHRHKGETVMYCHTKVFDQRGIDLNALRLALGIGGTTFFPSQDSLEIGIEQETMARTYNVMDVHLLPSKGEGFGMPIVESQACGVPNIITKCTSHAELLGGGWYVPVYDKHRVWTSQASWQFECDPDDILEQLEKAFAAWKDGSIQIEKDKARDFALQFDDNVVFPELWVPVLDRIEKKLKAPRTNLEGVQEWKLLFIPKTCQPRKVLDLGCGVTTPYKPYLEGMGKYYPVDKRNENGNGVNQEILVHDAHELPFKDNEFGFVWCCEVLEHCISPEKVVAEAKRVGKHGVMIFSTPQNPFFKHDPDHRIVRGVSYTTLTSGDGCVTW